MEYQRENKYYVYALVDPINKAPFYIGKGCGNRAYSHLKNEQTNSNKGKAGPGKVFVDNINDLKTHYINKNFTKEEICSFFNIGLGSLNRILKINNIKKTALNFSNYSKKSSQKL